MIAIAIDDVYIKGLPKNHLIPDTVKPVLKSWKRIRTDGCHVSVNF